MGYTLSSVDIGIWLTFTTIVLLVTAEVVSHFGPSFGLLVDKSRLRTLAFATGVLLFIIVVARILQFIKT